MAEVPVPAVLAVAEVPVPAVLAVAQAPRFHCSRRGCVLACFTVNDIGRALQASGLIFKDAVQTIAIEDPDGGSFHLGVRPFFASPVTPNEHRTGAEPCLVKASAVMSQLMAW